MPSDELDWIILVVRARKADLWGRHHDGDNKGTTLMREHTYRLCYYIYIYRLAKLANNCRAPPIQSMPCSGAPEPNHVAMLN